MKYIIKLIALTTLFSAFYTSNAQIISEPIEIKPDSFITIPYVVSNSLTKEIKLTVTTKANYSNLNIYSNNNLLVDNLDIPSSGTHKFNLLCNFESVSKKELKIEIKQGGATIDFLKIDEVTNFDIPLFNDISEKAGLDRVNSTKYGGPTVADINNDGYYDFIVNNHNQEPNKLYWNNGNGTVTKHPMNLSKWFEHDLHGSTAGDFDNDGDLDVVVIIGGGNGNDPSPPLFYRNDNGKLILMTGDVGITEGARGRSGRWSDLDKDGDLDLILINSKGINKTDLPQHLFYRNKGNGTFENVRVPKIENANAERVLVTDLNNDSIDDIILFSPLSIWQGNGDFTFSNINSQFPKEMIDSHLITAVTDIDVDNDGDLDLYFAKGKTFGTGINPSFDYDSNTKQMDIKLNGNKGATNIKFDAANTIEFTNYNNGRRKFKGEYPIFLGKNKLRKPIKTKESLKIDLKSAKGWPTDFKENGIYIGYTKKEKWQISIVRNDFIFWNINFSIKNVESVTPSFIPENRNVDDILLQNNNGKFTDISKKWNIVKGGNHQGVTVGDFNNDGNEDLLLHRWGYLTSRTTDYLLLNNGKEFLTTTAHGANDINDEGHGDMGQAFDFDLDGDIDLLNGSESEGKWYLYENKNTNKGNYALVRVNYSPKENIDPIAAVVELKTMNKTYRKRVGSSGEAFSQSVLNTVHFGLGSEETIKQIKVQWRNGETVIFSDKKANQLFDTNLVDANKISIFPKNLKIRKGTNLKLEVSVEPKNASKTVLWSSSDPSIASINKDGVLTAHKANKKVLITAKSVTNNVKNTLKIRTINFTPLPLKKIALSKKQIILVEGDTCKLATVLTPRYADNQNLIWKSSNTEIASVTNTGKITALSSGKTNINVTSARNFEICDTSVIKVIPLIEPSISFDNETKYQIVSKENKTLEVTVNYNAGTNGKVLLSDHGGIKVWFREFSEDWNFVKHVTKIDASAVGKQSGTSTISIPLENLVPSSKLDDGHFYLINASFVAQDGKTYSKILEPIILK